MQDTNYEHDHHYAIWPHYYHDDDDKYDTMMTMSMGGRDPNLAN